MAAPGERGESGADHAVAHSDGGAERGGGDLCPSNRAKCLPGGADGENTAPWCSAYLCCVWLIAAYQNRAADPVIQDYIYELLAVICVLLSVYYLSSFAFETPKAGRALRSSRWRSTFP